jgi:murein DD-endopeptidase MepM/ murein hydrolase activator NlpD
VALSSSSIAVSWVDNATNEAGFLVARWNGAAWVQVATVGVNVTSYTDTGLQPSTTYYHTVCAQNSAGTGCASTYSTTTTQSSISQFLSFPLSATLYPQGPYTPGKITSVLDHHMSAVYSNHDGNILSFTGESFQATAQYPITDPSTHLPPAACYPKAGNSAWSSLLSALYKGTGIGTGAPNDCSTNVALNYEAHPGYDYVAVCTRDAAGHCISGTGTPVYAAAQGHVVSLNGGCVPKGMSSCAVFGAIGIDHENGYISQYLHMDLSSFLVSPGDHVSAGQQIGLSGNTSPSDPPLGPHLHFEVLKLRSDASNDYSVDSYATVDPYGFDTSKGYSDYMTQFNNNLANICLWQGGCRFQ